MISRRDVLKSLMLLPSLGFSNILTKPHSKKKFIFINNSLGFYRPNFLPKKQGDFRTSIYLKEFQHSQKMTIIENLYHPGMETSNHASEKSFLTGAQFPESSTFKNSISIDQLLLNELKPNTRFQSLTLSTGKRGVSCNSQGNQIPPIYDEEKLFNLLSSNGHVSSENAEINNQLDIIKANLASSQTNFQTTLKLYRAEILRQKAWLNKKKPIINFQNKVHSENAFEDRLANIFNLAYHALVTNSTSIITINIPFTNSPIKVKNLASPEVWHNLSHHGKRPKKISKLEVIEKVIIKTYSQLLDKLESTKEGNGTMLDNTLVLMGSDMSQASIHKHDSLPIIVAGGDLKHKKQIKNEAPTPLCNLYTEFLKYAGSNISKFGTSTGVGQWFS